MSSAPKYVPCYTVSDYELWPGDWELWQGTAVAMTPSPFGRHQFVLVNLVSELRSALVGSDWRVLAEIDWRISETTVVRPDALVLIGQIPERHVEVVPVLIAEITSESTAAKDRTAKFDLYQQQGVAQYVLIDPIERTVENYVLDDSQHYVAVPQTDGDLSLFGPSGNAIRIQASRIFD